MRSAFSLRLLTIALIGALLAMGGLPATAESTSQRDDCANRMLPPPPVDTSEKPAPGEASPAPPPVPDEAPGGERMAECGLVVPADAPAPPPPSTAHGWLVQDLDTGAVLAAKNPHGRYRPASLIKTLLALVVIDELEPSDVVVPTREDANQECTCVGLVAGAEYPVDKLLHALLMRSGNDVAHALATQLGGVKVAVGKMNALAERLGTTDTRAATPSGLDGPGMMTSAYDTSLVFRHAMGVPAYSDAVGTQKMRFPGGGKKPAFPIYNDNNLFATYEGFVGGKTGFTDDARHTYAGAAERDGTRLAVILLRAEQRPIRVTEQAENLLDYGFRLAGQRTAAVGHVTTAPAAAKSAESAVSDSAADGSEPGASGAEEDPFGTTGWIVTLVVALIVLAGFVFGHRRGALRQSPH